MKIIFDRTSGVLIRIVSVLIVLTIGFQTSYLGGGVSNALAQTVSGFVTVQNGHFSLNGKPFKHLGVNEPALLYYVGYRANGTLENELDALQALGIKQVRVFLPDSKSTNKDIKDRVGWALDAAGARGIRLTIALTDMYGANNITGNRFLVKGEEDKYYTWQCLLETRPDLLCIDPLWFTANAGGHGSTGKYLRLVDDVVAAYKDRPEVFAWEVGNEISMKPGGSSNLLVDFYVNTAQRIKAIDPNHLVALGMIDTDQASINNQQVNRLYTAPAIDYITIHKYVNDTNPVTWPDVGFASMYNKPIVLEEFGVKKDVVDQNGFQIVRNLYSSAYQQGMDAVLQWGVQVYDNYQVGDAEYGPREQNKLEEYKSLWQCRAQSLENANNTVNKIDLLFQKLQWRNLTNSSRIPPVVGDTVRFTATICNIGDVATDQGVGISFFLDNNKQSPSVYQGIGSTYNANNIGPGDQATIDFDWVVVDPYTLNTQLTAQNAVIVGLADDVNRYPNEITESNNGNAIDFPVVATATRAGFNSNYLSGNDDGSTGVVPLGFTAKFYGQNYTSVYINNNGNLTFDSSMPVYTPISLQSVGHVIIAPFFADVDTRTGNVVTYGTGSVGGQYTFGANWPDVGCFGQITSVLNRFQVLLISRTDIAPGDFDIEFNYDKIQWEAGTASGGNSACQGGVSARAGYSNGVNVFELTGSGIDGAFLDSNLSTGLVHNSLNSSLPGRYIIPVRNGIPQP